MSTAPLANVSFEFDGFVWVNADSMPPGELKSLADKYGFHPLDVEDCLSKTKLPKIDEYMGYLFVVLHFPSFRKERKYSVPEQVSFFIGKEFLVTVHSGELTSINRLFAEYAKNGACSVERFGTGESVCGSPVFFLYKVIYALIENLMGMLGKVLSNIEGIEEKVFDEKADIVREVTELRHDIANLRRIVYPLKRVLHELEKKIGRFDVDMGAYYGDLSDHIDRAWAVLEECKETIEIYKDTDFISSTESTNKILTFLTIIFTFSIPVSTLGTIWGMNVELPGSTLHPWTFWGRHTTLYVIILSSAASVVCMYAAFRRLRWL